MRCSASPTTCSVDSATALRAGQMLEAMLLAPVLRPLFADVPILDEYEFAEMIAASLKRAP
jgi:hypothetical protein